MCRLHAMAAIVVFVLLVAALGVAVVKGWTADSRDSEYGLGRVIAQVGVRRPASIVSTRATLP